MGSPKFTLGMILGALTFAFVMVNLWFWNIIPTDTMYEFNRNPHNQYMVVAIAFASMLAGGFLCAALCKRKKKPRNPPIPIETASKNDRWRFLIFRPDQPPQTPHSYRAGNSPSGTQRPRGVPVETE